MYYAHGLVDKNNIIRTVEDIMCSANDSSHETITDFKEGVENRLNDVYSKNETLNLIATATNELRAELSHNFDSAWESILCNNLPDQIDSALNDLMNNQLPDQYYNKDEVNNEIENKINEHKAEITIDYATKEFVNTTKNNILNECSESFYTKQYIKDNYYKTIDHDNDFVTLQIKIGELENRIKNLEQKS